MVPGDQIRFSCWVRWADLVVTAGEAGMQLGAVAYLGTTAVDMPVFGQISFTDWTANSNITDTIRSGWCSPTATERRSPRPT